MRGHPAEHEQDPLAHEDELLDARDESEVLRHLGGHVFSQSLLTCGFPESRAVGALDNDPAKQGLRLYGTDLMVVAPSSLASVGRCAVVVRAAHDTPEITAQLHGISGDIEVW